MNVLRQEMLLVKRQPSSLFTTYIISCEQATNKRLRREDQCGSGSIPPISPASSSLDNDEPFSAVSWAPLGLSFARRKLKNNALRLEWKRVEKASIKVGCADDP
jgi:hypothetical protein